MKNALKITLIILGCLAVLAGGLFLVYKLKFDPYRGTSDLFTDSMRLEEEISVAQAVEDIDYCMGMMRSRHPAWLEENNERVRAVEETYLHEVESLNADEDGVITVLDEWCIISRITHELYDGHTRVWCRYSDERYISDFSQVDEYGLPVKINGEDVDDIEARFLDVYQYEMEEYARQVFASKIFINESYLKWVGVDVSDGVTFTYDTPEGEKDFHYDFVPIGEVAGRESSGDDDGFVHYSIDTENKIGIFTLESCDYNDEYIQTVKDFFNAVHDNSCENVIVDLRWNGGGSSYCADEFLKYLPVPSYYSWPSHVRFGDLLVKNDKELVTNHRKDPVFAGNVYVLTNLASFSAAMDFAMLVMDNGMGTVVVQHCGNLPDSYGDILNFTTPNSGLHFDVSYKRWFRVDETKAGEPLEPDYPCDSDEAMDVAYSLILGTYTSDTGKINDNGKPIADFYEFINADWEKKQEESGTEYYMYADDERNLVRSRVYDILENTDLSTLSEDDDLYKVITLYRELMDTSTVPERMDVIRERVEKINSAKTLNDLYALYADEEYALYDLILDFDIEPDDNGYISFRYAPEPNTQAIASVAETLELEDENPDTEFFYAYMNEFGFSKERTNEIFSNASQAANMVEKYSEAASVSPYLYYFGEEKLSDAGVTLPIIEILDGCLPKSSHDYFLADESVTDFWNELYTPENFEYLRDHMILGCAIGGFIPSGYQEFMGLEDVEYYELILTAVMNNCKDVLAKEYMIRYADEETLSGIRDMSQEVKSEAARIFETTEWMSSESREAASAKVLRTRISFGENGAPHMLYDYEITGNAFKDYVDMCLSFDRFEAAQTFKTDDVRQIFGYELFDVNARYYDRYNKLVISSGLMCSSHCSSEAPFEERLGSMGVTIAHEIFHAFDSKGIGYDLDGYFISWITDDELREYYSRLASLAGTLDGMDIGFGRTLNGNLMTDETVADLMAVRVCLNILSEREDPDYDLFFRTFAESKAEYYTESAMDYVETEPHLPGRIRVNFVLGQFDEFYDTYDIDENSPWYVPEDSRISIF